jgi:predicted small secreted protein
MHRSIEKSACKQARKIRTSIFYSYASLESDGTISAQSIVRTLKSTEKSTLQINPTLEFMTPYVYNEAC